MVSSVTIPGTTLNPWFTPGKAEMTEPFVEKFEEINNLSAAEGFWLGGKAIQNSVPTLVTVWLKPEKRNERMNRKERRYLFKTVFLKLKD
jgi:hypothetical protein